MTNILDNVSQAVVLGIWGRAGGDGIPELVEELRPRLVNLGVPDNHILSISWNPDDNDNPFSEPNTSQHMQELHMRESSPSYVALIGHSYGGWAACRLSRKLSRQPNFVGLIDPVFGPLGDHEQVVKPYGDNTHNWYQKNSITKPTFLEDCSGTVVGCLGGISCGRRIDGVMNHKVKWCKDWNGRKLMRDCRFGKKPRHAFHTGIDSDRHIWRQIIEQIESDIRSL